jgi:hypothetical protein
MGAPARPKRQLKATVAMQATQKMRHAANSIRKPRILKRAGVAKAELKLGGRREEYPRSVCRLT